MTSVLVLCGGSPHAHDFRSIGDALTRTLEAAGSAVTIVGHPDEFARQIGAKWDLVIVHALWWTMTGDAYDEWRPDWGYHTTPATARAIDDHVRCGGALLSLHTAPICFDDWPKWGEILGGAWEWGVSSHPPKRPFDLHFNQDHPMTRQLASVVTLEDEVYGDMRMSPDSQVLAVARRHPSDTPQPIVWTHDYGLGTVAHIGVGHDAHSIEHPAITLLITQAVEWLTTRVTART